MIAARSMSPFPNGAMESFRHQFVPRWTSTPEARIRGIGAALRRIR